MIETSSLNADQRSAVHADHDLICMMAGPGSGKTHTLIERAKRLVAGGADPSAMVIITFTNEAANELLRRSDLEFGYCGTLHGYMLRVLQTHGEVIGLRGPLAVISAEQQDALLKDVSKECGYRGTKGEMTSALALGRSGLQALQSGVMSKAQTAALAYYQRLVRDAMVDYDSILHLGLEVAQKLDAWDLKAIYLFVDEYQDSSPLDALIYQALPVCERFYIGDPDQAIYNFRGATVENITELAQREDALVLALEDNYRCRAEICEAAQRLIEHNANRPQKETRSVREDSTGHVEFAGFDKEREELVFIARTLNQMPDANECAVLVRTNYLVEYFRDGLEGLGVLLPQTTRAAAPKDWKRALLLLSLLCNPENDRLAYAWLLETKGTTKADAVKLEALAGFETINDTALHFVIDPSKPSEIPAILVREHISTESVLRVERALEHLPEGATLPELAATLQHEQPARRDENGVTVSTIHGAKGREWDHVFLPAFEDGVLPSLSTRASIEEERRLAFVAMTRARHTLTISHAATRREAYKFGERQMQPSRFLTELQGGVH